MSVPSAWSQILNFYDSHARLQI